MLLMKGSIQKYSHNKAQISIASTLNTYIRVDNFDHKVEFMTHPSWTQSLLGIVMRKDINSIKVFKKIEICRLPDVAGRPII